MPGSEEQFDEAMGDFSRADYATAIRKLEALVARDDQHLDARLALGMAYCRQGDLDKALAEGHKAEAIRPHDQLVHTNLSLFYVKKGDKQKAEHHGLQARIASWREKGQEAPPAADSPGPSEEDLSMAGPKPEPMKFTGKLPDMPWKKKEKDPGPPPDPPPPSPEKK